MRASSSRGLNGFWKVIISPQLKADDAVNIVATRCEHENWNVRPGAEHLQNFHAAQSRKHNVQNDKRVDPRNCQFKAGITVMCGFQLEPLSFDSLRQEGAKPLSSSMISKRFSR